MADIRVTSREGEGSVFKDWKYEPLESILQAYFDRKSAYVIVNANHPVNKVYFGETAEEAEKAAESNPHCQMLLADLILNECLMFTYGEAYLNLKVERRDLDAPWADIWRYIHEQKHRFGKQFYEHFVRIPLGLGAQEEKAMLLDKS